MVRKSSKQISNSGRHRESSRSNIDLLSQLPDDLLIEIIRLLPTKEAVQTSVLNKSWINLWKQIHNINSSFKEYKKASLKKEFDGFDIFLGNLDPSITKNKFSVQVHCNPIGSHDRLDSCLSWAIERRVRMLALDIKIPGYYTNKKLYRVPAILFQCQSLAELELCNVAPLNLHNRIASWPFLKGLNLTGTELNVMDFSNLVESCPLLERLSLVRCALSGHDKQPSRRRICSTSLRCLKLWKCRIIVLNLPSLVKISIEMYVHPDGTKQRALLNAVNHVEEVHVGAGYMQAMCKNGIKKSTTVKHVQVEITIDNRKRLEGMAYLISSYPNLQTLVLIFNNMDHFIRIDDFQGVLDGGKVLKDCLLGMLNLKTIHVCGIKASEVKELRKDTSKIDNLMEFRRKMKYKIVRILLKKLIHLEELTIYVAAKGCSDFGSKSHLVEETRKLFETASSRPILQVTCEPYDCPDWSDMPEN